MKLSDRRKIGYAAFFLALGMLLGLVISSKLLAVLVIAILLIMGYLCICC